MEQEGRPGGWRRVATAIGWWTLVALFFTAENALTRAAEEQPVDLGRLLSSEILIFTPWAILSPAVAVLTRRYPVVGEQRGRHLLVHGAAGLVCALVHTAMGVSLGWLLEYGQVAWGERYLRILPRLLGGHLAMYGSLVAVLHAARYYRAFRERELQASQLEAQLAQAQLAVLRTQLQPHFLFNTLHTVSALMARDVTAARRTLSRLSELLRQSLDAEATPEVSVREELALLEHYLEIQRTRFEDRLQVELHVEPEALEGAVPRLLLQPLVENALRHGLAPRADGGRVEVKAERREGRLHLTVADDGVGLPAGLTAPPREGVGLRHTRARLRALYGEAHAFDFRPRPGGGVEVHLALPWRPASPARAA